MTSKMPWAKGRKEQRCYVPLPDEVHKAAKEAAYEEKMTIKEWVSEAIKEKLKRGD